jgi:hypothetical protein
MLPPDASIWKLRRVKYPRLLEMGMMHTGQTILHREHALLEVGW